MPAGPTSPRLSYALSQVFSRRWWGVSLAVLVISLGLARLGIWQLDRLAERRARSATLEARLAAPPLLLSRAGLTGEGVRDGGGALPDLDPLAYRRVVLRGSFDYAREVALVNQVRQGQLGFHLLTPLVLEGEGPPGATPAPGGVTPVPVSAPAVLVDRGWVPAALPGAAQSPQDWAPYRAPGAGSDGSAVVQVTGWVRPPPAGPPRAAAGSALPERLVADLHPATLQERVGRPLLPLVVVQVPDAGAPPGPPPGSSFGAPARVERAQRVTREGVQQRQRATPEGVGTGEALPYRQAPNPDLGDGVHVIAAVQWFAFSVIGVAGYLIYLGRQLPPGAYSAVERSKPDDHTADDRHSRDGRDSRDGGRGTGERDAPGAGAGPRPRQPARP
ncbi:MAG TPA: SURF1 family protein [Chloroflexota bacterium]|nr:SURF1 family protein [Chloroflexota bacterium]